MRRDAELELIDELLGLKEAKSAFLDDGIATSPVTRYHCAERFQDEIKHVFRATPLMTAHGSELPEANAFLRRKIAGLPVLLTRDGDNKVHAFLNVCRHRGARLVEDGSGCKKTFSCPYHAWTWDNRGELRGIPHEEQGFPDLDKSTLGLRRLPCEERLGWIWVTPNIQANPDLDAHVGDLEADLAWLGMSDFKIAHSDEIDCAANWKLLIEGGMEAYHFRVAHRDTIAPYFIDNLSTYRMIGAHVRSVLPRASLPGLADQPREDWSIRDHTNILYSVFPASQLLVQQDHAAWICLEPLAADRTLIRLSTVAPATTEMSEENAADYWRRNHDITVRTLSEDFDIAESVQSGFASGANDELRFGRYEGALDKFNTIVDDHVRQANQTAR